MAFGIGMDAIQKEHAAPKGELRNVAVKCWFTSKGRSFPLMMKIETEQGEILSVDHIQMLTAQQQNYAGILTWNYRCLAEANGQVFEFTLLFTPEDCSWKLVW